MAAELAGLYDGGMHSVGFCFGSNEGRKCVLKAAGRQWRA